MKKIMLIALIALSMALLASCNKQIIDTTYQYNYAYIDVSGAYRVQGAVESWTDYQDGDQIQVKIDGVTYLVHSENVTLVYDPNYSGSGYRELR